MSEHPAKGHAVAGIIMVLIIAGLMTWLFSVMSSGDIVGALGAGLLLVLVGAYAVLGLGRAKA
jgi:hypothetical protein